MAAHDVTHELRDYRGRWALSGTLKRLAGEAEQSRQVDELRRTASLEDIHRKILEVAALPEGKGKGVNGFMVRNTPKGLRVTMPGATQHYRDPREAAVAAFRKQHHREGESPLPLPGSGPTPAAPKGPERPPRAPAGPVPGPETVYHPQEINVEVYATDEYKKLMRQQVLKATTKQAEITPGLVSRTSITITSSPHGKSGGTTLASHSGQLNTLHVKPEVLVSKNSDAVLENGQRIKKRYVADSNEAVNSAWWVPSDPEHDLSMNVMTHEFGHGIHGEITRLGFIEATRHAPLARWPQEQEFWVGLAKAMRAKLPLLERDSGGEFRNMNTWHSMNKDAIRKGVSEYATENLNEMVAELWAEYRLSSNPRPAAKYFGDYVRKALEIHERLIS